MIITIAMDLEREVLRLRGRVAELQDIHDRRDERRDLLLQRFQTFAASVCEHFRPGGSAGALEMIADGSLATLRQLRPKGKKSRSRASPAKRRKRVFHVLEDDSDKENTPLPPRQEPQAPVKPRRPLNKQQKKKPPAPSFTPVTCPRAPAGEDSVVQAAIEELLGPAEAEYEDMPDLESL